MAKDAAYTPPSLSDEAHIAKAFHKRGKAAYRATEKCYIVGCDAKPINAHSVTNNRLLRKIADSGRVIYFSTEELESDGRPSLVATGRKKATAFPGFCDHHDKIFEPIDNRDYLPGDQQMEFLFALRASAREYTTRQAMDYHSRQLMSDFRSGRADDLPAIDSTSLARLEAFQQGFQKGTQDLEDYRGFFNRTMETGHFWKIQTEVVTLDAEFPIVASSTFKLELAPNGALVNDPADLKARHAPFYLTLFPQGGRSYCLLQWHHRDRRAHGSVRGVGQLDERAKRAMVSNLLTGYVENFAANPSYWKALPARTREDFDRYFGLSSQTRLIPFIFDEEYSLFRDRMQGE